MSEAAKDRGLRAVQAALAAARAAHPDLLTGGEGTA